MPGRRPRLLRSRCRPAAAANDVKCFPFEHSVGLLITQNIESDRLKVNMGPSHTVENYLKAIFQAQIASGSPDGLVAMGQLASALGVVPGTATTMVKALADSGLAR